MIISNDDVQMRNYENSYGTKTFVVISSHDGLFSNCMRQRLLCGTITRAGIIRRPPCFPPRDSPWRYRCLSCRCKNK